MSMPPPIIMSREEMTREDMTCEDLQKLLEARTLSKNDFHKSVLDLVQKYINSDNVWQTNIVLLYVLYNHIDCFSAIEVSVIRKYLIKL